MEKFIHAMMATIIAILTTSVPLVAAETSTHHFKCHGRSGYDTTELTGSFDDIKASFKLYTNGYQTISAVDAPITKLDYYGDVVIDTHPEVPKYGYSLSLYNFFMAKLPMAKLINKGSIQSYTLSCN